MSSYARKSYVPQQCPDCGAKPPKRALETYSGWQTYSARDPFWRFTMWYSTCFDCQIIAEFSLLADAFAGWERPEGGWDWTIKVALPFK